MNRLQLMNFCLAAFFMVLGGGCTVWTWYSALNLKHYSPKMAFLFPAIFVLGVGHLIFSLDEERLIASYVNPPSKLSELPFIYKVIVAVALSAAVINSAVCNALLTV